MTFVLCPHSVILWLGDLNYRIEDLDVEKVKKLIEEKAFHTLYAYDQVWMAGRLCPFRQLSSHCQGREKPGFPTLSLFFLSLGGFPEELTSSQIFLSPASPSCTVVSPSACPLRYLVSLGSWSMRSFSLSLSPVSVCSFFHSS